jgi:hypothetical protein
MQKRTMAEQKIQTRHPDSAKNGVNISKRKYEQVREAIVQAHYGTRGTMVLG